jgi:hypothetical protein
VFKEINRILCGILFLGALLFMGSCNTLPSAFLIPDGKAALLGGSGQYHLSSAGEWTTVTFSVRARINEYMDLGVGGNYGGLAVRISPFLVGHYEWEGGHVVSAHIMPEFFGGVNSSASNPYELYWFFNAAVNYIYRYTQDYSVTLGFSFDSQYLAEDYALYLPGLPIGPHLGFTFGFDDVVINTLLRYYFNDVYIFQPEIYFALR